MGAGRTHGHERGVSRVAALTSLLLLAACRGSGGGDDPAPSAIYLTAPGVQVCSIDDIKARVDFDMRDYYVFADRVPDLSPAQFDAPERQIVALRVAPDTFSSVSDLADFQAQSAGREVGFGFRLQEDEAGIARFRTVVGGSPAALAGLERGDVLDAIDGEPLDEIGAGDALARLRDTDEGEARTFSIERGGEALDVRVVKAGYTTDTVAGTFAFDAADGTRTGYLPVSQFAESTAEALEDAFAFFVDEGAQALVVDVRYNPGGLIDAANRLAVHVAGRGVAGATFVQYLYNERYARELNFAVPFEAVGDALDLDRVVFIATGESASASELAINGLRPFVDVAVVGSTTFGKAFGSTPRQYCDKAINAMAFITANAEGVTVAGGIEPDCAVEDAWRFPLGNPNDALSGAAFRLLADGTCASDTPGPQAGAPGAARDRGPAAAPLWDDTPRLVGALARP